MRVVRRFPDPDPLIMLIDPESLPTGVWTWPPQERAQRLRYALISLCAGIHPVVAWPLAFNTDPESEAAIERTLEVVDDAEIERMVASTGRADWMRR